MGAGVAGAILGLANTAANVGMTFGGWMHQKEMMEQDRAENYEYNEHAARNADVRQRLQYQDMYSPEALMRQYKAAGLSPSLMFDGTPGQGSASGSQGAGAAGPTRTLSPFMPASLMEAAQAAALFSQVKKQNAETKLIDEQTAKTAAETQWQELQNGTYKNEFEILNSTWTDEKTGKDTSIFETARNSWTYEQFLEKLREYGTDETIKQAISTETGQKTLRAIFVGANAFHRDIMVLSAEGVSAQFQANVMEKLNDSNFAQLNAEAAVKYLEANIETAELTKTQKEAWNNLLDGLGKKNATVRDIVVVLGMIFNNAMSNWKMPQFGDHVTNNNIYQQ